MVLYSFREQLQQHVRVHAVEAVMACREIEQSLQDLTGTTTATTTSLNSRYILFSGMKCLMIHWKSEIEIGFGLA